MKSLACETTAAMHMHVVCHVTRSLQSLIDIYLHDESFIITVKCTYIPVRERRLTLCRFIGSRSESAPGRSVYKF